MSYESLSPTALVNTTESIRGTLFFSGKRKPLVDAGFDWAAFEQRHVELENAGVGYRRANYPIVLAPDAGSTAALVLDSLRADLSQLRALAPKVFARPEQLDELIACTVPDGTSYMELEFANPEDVHVISLQDFPLDMVAPELPRISKMVHVQAIYLFGVMLTDQALSAVDFSGLSKLRLLSLSENRLRRFPAVTMLQGLESLDLGNNPTLSVLTPDLNALSGLRRLNLQRTASSPATRGTAPRLSHTNRRRTKVHRQTTRSSSCSSPRLRFSRRLRPHVIHGRGFCGASSPSTS